MKELVSRWGREVQRAVSWHRRLVAAGLAGGAVAAGITALTPAPPPTVAVLAAGRDLAAGKLLENSDLSPVRLPSEAVPAGALREGDAVAGRVLAGPMRRGEPLTDVRLVGPTLLAGHGPGLVGAPVRIADPGAVRLLRPGDVVDVLAAETSLAGLTGEPAAPAAAQAPAARVVAGGVRVLAVPAEEESALAGSDAGGGALVVLATGADVASALARAAVTARLSVTLRPA